MYQTYFTGIGLLDKNARKRLRGITTQYSWKLNGMHIKRGYLLEEFSIKYTKIIYLCIRVNEHKYKKYEIMHLF